MVSRGWPPGLRGRGNTWRWPQTALAPTPRGARCTSRGACRLWSARGQRQEHQLSASACGRSGGRSVMRPLAAVVAAGAATGAAASSHLRARVVVRWRQRARYSHLEAPPRLVCVACGRRLRVHARGQGLNGAFRGSQGVCCAPAALLPRAVLHAGLALLLRPSHLNKHRPRHGGVKMRLAHVGPCGGVSQLGETIVAVCGMTGGVCVS